MMESSRTIANVLQQHLRGKKGKIPGLQSLFPVVGCFQFLLCKARPAFLYDMVPRMDNDRASLIVSDLRQIFPALSNLIVLDYNQDILFVCLSTMLDYLDKTKALFIDVSAGLEDTHILPEDEERIEVKHARQCFREITRRWKENPNLISFSFDSHPDICGPSIIGLILGYPAIYYLSSEDHSLNSCLLTVTSVELQLSDQFTAVFSFSVPEALFYDKCSSSYERWKDYISSCLASIGINYRVRTFNQLYHSLIL